MHPLPDRLQDLPTPSLVLDLDVLERNVERMARRMRELGVALRPHFKTHKSPEVAAIQHRHGAESFTVSTLAEARCLIDAGYSDLTWAFPVIFNRLGELRPLLQAATLRLVVDSPAAIEALERELAGVEEPARVWLKVDCGYHRAGVDPQAESSLELARRLRDSGPLTFDGILSHSGHAYHQRGRDGLRAVAEEERRVMAGFAARLRAAGIDCPGVSIGSTPAMSVVESLEGVTEARPGNYVFYDYTQVRLGACEVRDVALTVMASVVSSQPGAQHSVIDAGALSLSKDPGPDWTSPRRGASAARPTTYGEIFSDYAAGELSLDLGVVSLSQEHGILSAPLPVGQKVRVLPNHSCLVVPNFDRYVLARGEEVVGSASIWRH